MPGLLLHLVHGSEFCNFSFVEMIMPYRWYIFSYRQDLWKTQHHCNGITSRQSSQNLLSTDCELG